MTDTPHTDEQVAPDPGPLPEDSGAEGAQETAGRLAGRIRGGDVRHDPKGGDCPSWCDLWPMCRVRRA